MKTLAVSALVCALMALTRAAAFPGPKAANDQADESELVKRSIGMGCSTRWTNINGRYFRFVPKHLTWAQAERNCQSMGGNLASVHSTQEYNNIQWLIKNTIYEHKKTWIGGSDAQENNIWLWSDGTTFRYSHWCRGEPNNGAGQQHCMQMNYGARKCWDDLQCNRRLPSICAKKAQ